MLQNVNSGTIFCYFLDFASLRGITVTGHSMEFSFTYFFSENGQIRGYLRNFQM